MSIFFIVAKMRNLPRLFYFLAKKKRSTRRKDIIQFWRSLNSHHYLGPCRTLRILIHNYFNQNSTFPIGEFATREDNALLFYFLFNCFFRRPTLDLEIVRSFFFFNDWVDKIIDMDFFQDSINFSVLIGIFG